MGSLASVATAVDRILATEPRLDVLIDNAGAIHAARSESPDGIEATLALLVVGPFALEHGLVPLLRRTPGSRVIAVTSGGMYAQRLPLDDLQFAGGDYDGTRAYARAKRAQVALMREWSRRSRGSVAFAAMHPGWADTPGLAEALPGFHRVMRPLLRSTAQGIDTIVWLATHPDAAASTGGCTWTAARGRSTASARPGSRRAIAGACGTSSPGSRESRTRRQTSRSPGARPVVGRLGRSASPDDRLGHGRGGIDDAIGHPHGARSLIRPVAGGRRPADGDQRHVVLEQRLDDIGCRLPVGIGDHADDRRPSAVRVTASIQPSTVTSGPR